MSIRTERACIYSKLSIAVICLLAWTASAAAAPTTEQFISAMSACGLGSHISLDNQTKSDASLMFTRGISQGRAVQDITVQIARTITEGKQPAAYEQYVKCLRDILSLGATPEGRQEALLLDFSENTPRSRVLEAYGAPSREVNQKDVTFEEYAGDSHYLFVVRKKKDLVAVAMLVLNEAAKKTKQIPFLGLQEAKFVGEKPPQFGSEEFIDRSKLIQLPLSWLSESCENLSVSQTDHRFGIFSTTKCFFGKPGGYHDYYFGFNVPDAVQDRCHVSLFRWEISDAHPRLSNVRCKFIQALPPEFVFVSFSSNLKEKDAATMAGELYFWRYSGFEPVWH